MPTPRLTDEQVLWAVEAVKQHGGVTAAAKALGLKREKIRKRMIRAAERGLLSAVDVLPGFVIKTLANKTADGTWIKQTKEPGEVFEIAKGQRVSGVSALTDSEGRVVQQWIKTKAGTVEIGDLVAAIKAAFEGWEARAPGVPEPVCDDDLATVYVCNDWHIGVLCAKEEVGHNWDTKLARKVIGDSIARLVAASPPARQAVILGLGDLLHADGYDHRTPTSKFPLDVDGRYPLLLKAATTLLIAAVTEALQKHEKVLVRVLAGNHDTESSVAISLALSMFYSDDPRVTVDDEPSRFWWWEFGINFLGAHHGDGTKQRDLPMVMASRNPEAWGRSRYRAILTGHVHHQSAVEVAGVIVESFQAPIPVDHWHHLKGYGAGRSLNSLTFHREFGEVSRNKVNVVIEQ